MRILIVGDKEEERALLRQALRDKNLPWREAHDGDEGWLAYLDYAPHIILSDFVMPGRNGLQLTQDVRRQPFEHYTYIVLLSTLAEKHHVMEGLRAGADDYLSKPVDLDELELRLLSAHRVSQLHQRLAQQKAALEDLTRQLREESRRDALTQVGNRFRLHDRTPDFLKSHAPPERPCWVALCDIDGFKQYNDIYGHHEGDKVLKLVAQHLHHRSPPEVEVYRFGGEEFLLTFTDMLEASVVQCLEQLRTELHDLNVTHLGNPPHGRVTLTLGYHPLEEDTAGDLERAIKMADAALYEGKRSGKNQVVRAAQ
jgi:diguanylate cyclase (GGDEF)-like protein